jgi:fructose-bisphosphate aldolase class I
VITIGKDIPSVACIEANAHALARYSAACQEASIVRSSSPRCCSTATTRPRGARKVHLETLEALFTELARQDVSLEHVILKASMCVSGKDNPKQASVAEVAERTLRVLEAHGAPRRSRALCSSRAARPTRTRPRTWTR